MLNLRVSISQDNSKKKKKERKKERKPTLKQTGDLKEIEGVSTSKNE